MSEDRLRDYRASGPEHLLRTQRKAVTTVLTKIIDIANGLPEYNEKNWSNSEAEILDIYFNRPHHVFTIDGARGAGKTYVLLTLAHTIQLLSSHWRNGLDHREVKPWWDFITEGDKASGIEPRHRFKYLAQVIRLIFPSDMERQESVMERIFASMEQSIDQELQHLGSKEKDDAQLKSVRDMQKELVQEIVPGWHFSRIEGREIILRDAVDYNDFSILYEQEAKKSVFRIENWRKFLIKFLNYFETAILAVFLDDSDVQPKVTEDILTTLRMFLNHPRVVTVLAGNVRSMRGLLLHEAMRTLGQSMDALPNKGTQTAMDWRRIERRGVEDYLEKVLPQSQRFFIQPPATTRFQNALDAEAEGAVPPNRVDDDFSKIAKIPLDVMCENILSAARKPFLAHKFTLAVNQSAQQSDRPGPAARRALDTFLSWWVFRTQYYDALAPRSARHIRTLQDYYITESEGGLTGFPAGRRLIMALFENPANFPLIQQFNDDDTNVVTWLQDQLLNSMWVGPRRFDINGRILDREQFAYDYIRYRLDVGLAMPLRQNAEEAMPLNLLPVPHGRTHLRRFFHPKPMARRHRRLGICQWIDHAAIPGNCISFHDLDALPDRSLLHGPVAERRMNRSYVSPTAHTHEDSGPNETPIGPGLGQGYWEDWVAHNWTDLIADFQDELTYRYFAEVVCASQVRLYTVQTSELTKLLDPPSLVQEQSEGIYEFFWREEFSRFAYSTSLMVADDEEFQFRQREWVKILDKKNTNNTRDLVSRVAFVLIDTDHEGGRKEALDVSDAIAQDKGVADLVPKMRTVCQLLGSQEEDAFARYERIRMRSLGLYSTILNDVRRAWHAIRIYDLSMGALGRAGNLGAVNEGQDDERVSFAVLAAQDRLPLYTANQIREQFESTPWTKALLQAFGRKRFLRIVHNILDHYNNDGKNISIREITDRNISLNMRGLFSKMEVQKARFDEVALSYNSKPDQNLLCTLHELSNFYRVADKEKYEPDEKQDYLRWTRTLRAAGRVTSRHWPDFGDHADDGPPSHRGGWKPGRVKDIRRNLEGLEECVLGKEGDIPRLSVLKLKANDGKSSRVPNSTRANSRSARNFALLLYGLAPSLPALIHCHLMGILREAEFNYQARDIADVPRNDTKSRYEEVNHEINAWANLVISLSLGFRYVRVKYLHLHMALWLDTIHDAPIEIKKIEEKRAQKSIFNDEAAALNLEFYKNLPRTNYNFIWSLFNGVDLEMPPDLSQKLADEAWKTKAEKSIVDELRALFEPENAFDRQGEVEAADELQVMPDFSSSTVFGERWLRDTLVSLMASGRFSDLGLDAKRPVPDADSEMPQKDVWRVDGVFQETEQWLWATMRCLKKFHRELKWVIANRVKQLDDEIAAESTRQ